jgi:type I restriction enzyme S subunit
VAVGATVKSLRLRHFEQFPILLIDVPEQQRIVAILDEAFERIATARANAEKNLENARALFAAYLNFVFTEQGEEWVRKTLREVASEFGRGKSKHRPRNDPRLYGGSYPFIQTGDVRNSEHEIHSYTQTYNEFGLAQSKLWPVGTLCITIAANIAETGVLGFEACFPDSVIGLVADETQSSSKFVEYLLQHFKSELQARGKGSAQDNINLATFENLTFPFPSLELQASVIATLDSLRVETQSLESVYQRKLVALDTLKQSLLHHAFSGQL